MERGGVAFFLVCVVCVLCGSALASPQRPIDNIEHIIIFMQENRPFDHYFGMLNGVRGFNDRAGSPMLSGFNVFYQPTNQANLSDYMLPFRVDPSKTNAMCMPAPEMWYPTDLKMWNYGRDDSWNTARDPGMGMSYFTRADLPYYYTLYDEYVVGDQYFQSTFTSTNPNRMHLFTGSNGLSVGEPAVIDNTEPDPGYDWITMGEILQNEGITWRVYQERNNFDDNAFAWFEVYMEAKPGDPLYDNGMARQNNLFKAFEDDIQAGTLPQVSWIIAPSEKSEHATNHPCAGEDYTATLLNILWKYPDTYGKSVFILDYDEGGQFFDHAWPPTPPMSEETGLSTVTCDGEINTDVLVDEPSPVGMGWRVPLLLVSPWTRGHIVVSEVFDHTSVIKLIEERFNVSCPNISPWRRVVAGNLLSAFDFDHPNYTIPTDLPDTSDYVKEGDIQCATLPPPVVPSVQSMPTQEPQIRISRALPYVFLVSDGIVTSGNGGGVFVINMENAGQAGAPFIFYDVTRLGTVTPRQYAIEAGKTLSDKITVASSAPNPTAYFYTLLGPNGFVREFEGSFTTSCSAFSASLSYSPKDSKVVISVTSSLSSSMTFNISDNAYGYAPSTVSVSVENSQSVTYDVSSSGNWYDFTLTLMSQPSCFRRRFMGRMETGQDTISDPAMAAAVPSYRDVRVPEGMHPPMPESVRNIKRVESPHAKRDKDARFRFVVDEL